jgi:hypothetical protein
MAVTAHIAYSLYTFVRSGEVTAVSEMKRPPGPGSGLKNPPGLLGSSRYNSFSRFKAETTGVVIETCMYKIPWGSNLLGGGGG